MSKGRFFRLQTITFSIIFLTLLLGPMRNTAQGQASFPIQKFRLLSVDQAELSLTGSAEQVYTVEFSTNLMNWSNLRQGTPDSVAESSVTFFLDLNADWSKVFFKVSYDEEVVDPEPISHLDAPPDEPVSQHLPDMGIPRESDDEIQYLQGTLAVSMAHVLVTFDASTTVQQLNDLLQSRNISVAGAIPIMNLALIRIEELTTLDDLAQQIVELENTGLFTSVAPNTGLTSPSIEPSQESSQPQPQNAGNTRANWSWEADGLGTGSGGNNAFELSRIPQMWNWNDYGFRQTLETGGHDVIVTELAFADHFDLAFNVDLDFSQNSNFGNFAKDHGLAVAGIIGAQSLNGMDLDGVTPLARQVRGITYDANVHSDETTTEIVLNLFQIRLLDQLKSLLQSSEKPTVINMSLGMPGLVRTNATPFENNETVDDWVDRQGASWTEAFENLNNQISIDYLIVCAAGNDTNLHARYNSPMANIAIRPSLNDRVPNFLVVENVTGDLTPAPSSNYDHSLAGDAVSAGGSDVALLTSQGVQRGSGTSLAAPLVAGLASYLWSLDAELTVDEIKFLLLSPYTTQEVEGATRAHLVDGFAAALGIDLLRGNRELHKALIDVDDGTVDGNLREEIIYWSEDPDLIHTADGRRGDGVINMKDFRVFRDAWLHVIDEAEGLDGPPTHYKRDQNFDGLVENQAASPPHPSPYTIDPSSGGNLGEEVYSRYDFNGNGRLDEENRSASPPVESLGPFKVDPDRVITRRSISAGAYRDVDVLLNEDLWEQSEENVVLDNAPNFPDILPFDWTTNNLSTLFLSDLQSFDIHIDVEGGNPEARDDNYNDEPYFPIREGLEIQSYFSINKGRFGEWEGVITVPYDVIFDIPTVSVFYRESRGNEFHMIQFSFLGQKGEDIGLSLAFDDLQFFSNTREFTGYYVETSDYPTSIEAIGRRPGQGSYGGFFISFEDATSAEIEKRAREAALEALADDLLFPVAFNGSPAFEAIYETESVDGGIFVEIYGIEAMYNVIEATPRAPQQ